MSAADDSPSCRLYLVTPPALDPAGFSRLLAAALDGGDVACVQLRLKEVDDDTVRRAIDVLRPVAQDRDVAFILNDRPDLAAQTGCDGVHIGQSDTAYKDARRLVGADAIVGVTCHNSLDLAMDAGEAGADYVAFGAFHPTPTKDSGFICEIDTLRSWSMATVVPAVAIGGIDASNLAPIVQAGADFIAVVRAVWDHPDGPGAGVRMLNAAIAAALAG